MAFLFTKESMQRSVTVCIYRLVSCMHCIARAFNSMKLSYSAAAQCDGA